MLGLKRGTVVLQPHDPTWRVEANKVIAQLHILLGAHAIDIQHIGSTAVPTLHAKPIIDIAVAVESFEFMDKICAVLEANGFQFFGEDVEGQYLFGSGHGDIRTHHIHFVLSTSSAWTNYINFRDYLTVFSDRAEAYDALKLHLSAIYADDRSSYTREKQELITIILAEAKKWRQESLADIDT